MKKVKSFEEIMLEPLAKEFEGETEQSKREFDQRQNADWSRPVPQIAFVLLRCDAKRRRASIYEITDEALARYAEDFATGNAGQRAPDDSLMLLTLFGAKKRECGYAAGDWYRGWPLTKKGIAFAQDMELRKAVSKR